MECNIGQDAMYLTHSEMLYFLGIFIKAHSIDNNTIYVYKYNLLN